MVDLLLALGSAVGLFVYATVGVAYGKVLYNRFADADCRRVGHHHPKSGSREPDMFGERQGSYCACKAYSYPWAVIWPLSFVAVGIWKSVFTIAKGPAKCGNYIAEVFDHA